MYEVGDLIFKDEVEGIIVEVLSDSYRVRHNTINGVKSDEWKKSEVSGTLPNKWKIKSPSFIDTVYKYRYMDNLSPVFNWVPETVDIPF